MKTIFQVRFLLITIGILALALYIERHAQLSVSRSLGGPIEIAQSHDYSYTLFRLFRLLTVGVLMPCGIGLLVYGLLGRRHPSYDSPIGLPVLLALLTWWAWGLLTLLVYELVDDPFNRVGKSVFQLASSLTSIGWGIAAARSGYYQKRTPKQPVDEGWSTNAESY